MTSTHPPPDVDGGDLRTWRFDLPMTKPLSLNARQHWRAQARDKATVRRAAARAAAAVGIPACARIAVELHYEPRDRRRRDAINLVATLKPVEDGLVDAGVVPDDVARYVRPTMPVLDRPSGRGLGRLFVIVHELRPLDDDSVDDGLRS